jgi:glycerate-2-kinase
MVIKNLEQLIRNGQSQTDRRARELALKGFEAAIKAVNPKKLVSSKLMFKDPILKVDDRVFNLDHFRHIYVIGAGKASGSMAEALEALLGKRITDGIINVPRGCKHKTEIVKVNEASHPIPDESGVKGVKQMLEIAEKAGK